MSNYIGRYLLIINKLLITIIFLAKLLFKGNSKKEYLIIEFKNKFCLKINKNSKYLEIKDKKDCNEIEIIRLNSKPNSIKRIWEIANIINLLTLIPYKKQFERLLEEINFNFVKTLDTNKKEINYILDKKIRSRLKILNKINRFKKDCYYLEVLYKGKVICSISPNNNFWCADPFIFKLKKNFFLIFERYNPNTKFGQIDYIPLNNLDSRLDLKADSKVIKTLIKIENNHLAYPSPTNKPIYARQNKNDLLPWILIDNFSEKSLIRYQVGIKSDKKLYVKSKESVKNANLIDPIVINEDKSQISILGNYILSRECCILIIKKKKGGNYFNGIDFSDIKFRLPLHFAKSRNAGRFFIVQKEFYRPVQITSPVYGSGLIIETYTSKKILSKRRRYDRIHHIDFGSYPFITYDYYLGRNEIREQIDLFERFT